MRLLLFLFLLRLSILSLHADYTYIDATPANTTLNGIPIVVGPTPGSGGVNVADDANASNGDDAWALREVSSFEGGNYFETDTGSGDVDSENTPDLITTIPLGAAGTYHVVVVFSRNSNRDVAAKIGSSPSSTFADGNLFRADNSFNADQGAVTPGILFDSSYSNTRGNSAGAGYLGTVTTTSANETVSIYINGHDAGTGTNQRTQYDGVGYELTTPVGPTHRDVFLIAGQSNADGRGLNSELTGPLAPYAAVQSDVIIHYSNPAYGVTSDPLYQKWVDLRPGLSIAPGSSGSLPRVTFGMEIGAGTILSQHYDYPAFIKVTRGGTSLASVGNDWYPPLPDPADVGPLYNELITSTQQALQELTDAGDTYTVHGLFWHQGESDGGRESKYAAAFANFVSALRRDLGMPNLRIVVGELGPGKPQSFRDIQWQNSLDIRNASFVSSKNLTTSDAVTHFDTASAITYGMRLGEMLVGQGRVIDFEAPAYTISGLSRQNDFTADQGIEIATTTADGEYPGGQAAGNTSASGEHPAQRKGILPLAGPRSMQADFHPAETDSSLLAGGWAEDTNLNGTFDITEAGIAMGLGNDGLFHLRVGGNVYPGSGFPYQNNRWYRLTASWTDPDPGGMRMIILNVRDLTAGQNLNAGSPVTSTNIAASDPALWRGLGMIIGRGWIDNIGVEGPGFAGWVENRFPTLSGGPASDDDGDGIANGFEYALGLDPTRADPPATGPVPVLGPSTLTVSIPEIARAEDVLVETDASTDLTTWDTVPAQPSATSIDYVVPTVGEPKLFIRSRITISE